MRAFARPFSATPPPKQRSGRLRFLLECAGDVHEGVLEHTLHARGDIRKSPAFGGLDVDRLYDGRGGPNRSTNFDEYDRAAVVWYSKYSGTSANAPSGVRRMTLRTRSIIVGRP